MTDLQAHLEVLVQRPGDTAALEAISSAYRAEGRWEELLRVYEDSALRAGSSQVPALLRQAAGVCLRELASAPRAEAYLSRAIEAAPNDVESLRALREVLISRGDYGRGVELYEKEVARATDQRRKASGLVEVAEIYRVQLRRDDKALSVLRQAQRADRNNAAVYRSMAAIYELQGRLDQAQAALLSELEIGGANDDLLDRLSNIAMGLLGRPKLHDLARAAIGAVLTHHKGDQQALAVKAELDAFRTSWSLKVDDLMQRATEAGATNKETAADLWMYAAEIQVVYGEQLDEALALLDKAVASRPGHPGALRLMEEVYGAQDRYEDLALKLEMMAAYAREPAVAVELYLKAAMLYTVRLDSPEASSQVHQRVLQLDPGNKVSSNALAEFFRERRQWDAALAVLSAWAERATQATDKVAAHYACCRILEEELDDRARARPHYEAILSADPANHAAARALEEVYRDSGDHEALARALRAKVSSLSGEARAAALTELGELYAGPLDRAAEALDVLGELYRLTPTLKLRERLEELGAAAEAFGVLVKILEGGLEGIGDDTDRIQALHSLAALYEGAHAAPLEALRMHRRILALDPGDARAKESLERLLQAAAATGDKIAFYREQAEAAGSVEERVNILHKLARELVDTAKDYVRAIDVYRELLKLAPQDGAALMGLLGLFRRDNRWAEVAEVLLAKAGVAHGAERLALELELGQIHEERLGDPDRAVQWYCKALETEAGNAAATSGLERLLGRVTQVVRIAEVLQPRYAAEGRHDRAAAMLEIRVKSAADSASRVELLMALATLYDKQLMKPADALGALLRAFQADPTDSRVEAELDRLAAELNELAGPIRAYRAAGAMLEGEAAARMLIKSGALSAKAGDAAAAAFDFLGAVGVTDSLDAQALSGVAHLVQGGVTLQQITESALQVAAGLEDPRLTAYWRRLARFHEQDMTSTNDAITAWKEVLRNHHDDPEAMAELDRLYESADPAALVEHLQAKLATAEDDTTRAALGGQLAEIQVSKLNDLEAAVATLTHIASLVPGQRMVWRRLCELYQQAGKPQEAVSSLHHELGLMPDGEERHERLVVYAQLAGKELGDVVTAVRAVQGVLAQAPTHAAAIALLGELRAAAPDPEMAAQMDELLLAGYRGAGRFPEAVAMLTARADATADPAERGKLLQELASLKAGELDDAAGAYKDLERAFLDTPLDAALRDRLEQLAGVAEAWPQLAEAYTAALGVVSDAEAQKPLRRKLADILDKRLGRGAEAVEHYRAASGGDLPDDLPSLEAMERLLRDQQQLPALAEVLSAVAARLPADAVERKKAVLIELGGLCEETLADKNRAVETYRALAELDARDDRALRRLDALLADLDRAQDRAAILEALVAKGTQNSELVTDLVKLAGVMAQLGRTDEAVKHFRAVLLKRREHPEAMQGLESLLQHTDAKLEVAQILEPIYTAKQDHDKLAWVLEARLEGTTDKVQRKGLLRRIGDIYENRLQRKERAFAMARRSLHEDPSDMGVRMWIEKLAGETGVLADLADAYVEEAREAEAQLSLQFHRRAAAIYHEKLNDSSSAVREYRAILEIEAKDEKALSGLESIFRANEDHAELVELLRRRLASTAGLERKREYLNEIATLQSQSLADMQGAVATYREILALTPEDTVAFGQVEQLLAQLGSWEELAGVYESEIERLVEKRGRDVVARRLELMYRRARILDEQFGERGQAAEIFDAVLAENDAHASTISFLEYRAAQGILEAITILERVYEGQSAWQKYVELLATKLNHTAETDRRRPIYLALAETYDRRLNAGDMAFKALAFAHNENRADLELVEKMEELSSRHGNWAELVAVIGQDLDAIPDPAVRQYVLRRVGTVCGDKLGDVQRAIQYFQLALQYDPADSEALDALDALMERHEMWAALADLLDRRVELATEPRVKSRLLERLASVWSDRLMDSEAALRCHKQILEIDPDHPISLKSMQKLYADVQDWDALAKNLQRQAEVLSGPDEQLRIHAAAGELYAEELSDYDQAISHWQRVIELEPTHLEANQALEVLLTAEERWEELSEHYRRQLAHTQNIVEKSEINRRLGVILGDKLGRTDDALVSWLQVLEGDDKNLDALRALLVLYTERAMWEEFVGVARRLIPLADPAEAKDARFQLAKALGENLGEREEAIRLAREVRATEPHTAGQMTRLADMLKNIQAWDEAVIALGKAGALEEDPAAKVRLFYEAAEMYRDQLGKPNDAHEAYEEIRDVQPEDSTAYVALAQIYRDTAEWRKLVALDEDYVGHAKGAERLQILQEIRDVQDDKLGEKELAFIAACRVYKENAALVEAAEALERLGLETDGAEELVAVLEDEIDHIVDATAKIGIYRRVARVHADVLNDFSSAEACLEKVLEIEPGDFDALDTLAALGARQERFDKQIAVLERKLQHVVEDTARKSVLFDIARIWEDEIGEVDEAIAALQRVLEIDGGDVTALDLLARLFEQASRWPELAHSLTRKVELTEDLAESISLRMRVAGLCESELADPEAGIQWYRGVLEFDGGHAGALSALERLYTAQERWSELIQVFELQIAHAAESEEQIRILSKMASIYESEFDSAKDAAASYERVIQLDSTHIPSIKNLERLLRTLGEWHRLIEILQHHITLSKQPEEITELYLQVGEIYYRELAQVDKAEQIYTAARDFNPNSTAALHALGQLYERSGNWFQSLDMLQREAEALGTDPKALPVLLRIGKINEDMLGDTSAAKAAYSRAIEIDPDYGPALQALKEIARSGQDWDAYAEHLIAEAESSDDAEDKTELFHEAAKFFLEVREDEASAIRFFQRALEITDGHHESARALAEIYFRNEMWEEAGQLYAVVVQQLDKSSDPKDFCQKNYRLGYICEKLGDRENALQHYRRAFEADATYLPALEGLGQALLAVEQWEEAQRVFQTILIHHRESLTESEVVDVQWQIGDIYLKQNQPDRGYKQFEKALEIDPDHGPSLSNLAGLDERMENWEGAYQRLSRLADTVAGAERAEVLLRMSDIARGKLADIGRCVEALERARRMGDPPVTVLEQLAQAYLETHQPQKVIEALDQGIALCEQPEQLSELNFKLAWVYETQIKHEPMAVQKYNAALDAFPRNVKAFEAIERILGGRQQWAMLEENYRAMIARAKDLSPQVRLVLWRNLAELYRRVLKSVDHAIMAYEVIQKLEPGKAEDAAVLAELYAEKPEHRKKAIDMQHEVLRSTDNPVDPVRKLRKLYHAERNFDAVYALCSVLAFLREADEEERRILEYLQQGVPQRASQRLIEEHWKMLLHPGLQGAVGTLASWLYAGARDIFTRPAKDLGLKKKDQIDVRSSDLYFASMMRYVSKLLNIQAVDLFRKSGSMEPLHLAPSQPPAVVGGENHDVFRDSQNRVVLFHVGRTLAYARPELFLARVYPGDELRDLLLGMCLVYNRSLQHNGDPREVERWAAAFERLQPQVLKRLQAPARAAYAEIVQGRALDQYTRAVETTAARAGLIAAGDLAVAVQGLTEAGEGISSMPMRERIKELVLFSVSTEYMQLRQVCGAALVETQQRTAG